MHIKRFLTALVPAAILTLNVTPAMADFGTADAVIHWDSLTFSSPITWDLRESFVETGLAGGYTSQQADGFAPLFQADYNANSEVLANTMGSMDGAFANVGDHGYGYAYAELYGAFTPDHDMNLTISFDYELFGEVGGNHASSDSYVFLLLGEAAFNDLLTLKSLGGYDSGDIFGTASVTANLLANQTYDFSMGAAAQAAAVPLPGAAWLLGSCLSGLVVMRRKA
ncbi:MAG: hypothetical protein HY885_06360 [Deltaproteobacteria bacterium]|nr:hypothetical protein [Deltaproteobacteria bacterium]